MERLYTLIKVKTLNPESNLVKENDPFTGTLIDEPRIGEPLCIQKGFRMRRTSIVTNIRPHSWKRLWIITTLNSIYHLERAKK